MKKFIFSLCLFAIGLFACIAPTKSSAQVVTMTGSGDTVTNAETEYILYKAQTNYMVGIQLQVTKLSGTVAGTATIEASIDGTNYVTIPDADTLTLTNVSSQGLLWNFSPSPYVYYRLKITGSGTMAARVYGYMVSKKE